MDGETQKTIVEIGHKKHARRRRSPPEETSTILRHKTSDATEHGPEHTTKMDTNTGCNTLRPLKGGTHGSFLFGFLTSVGEHIQH